MPYSTYMTGSAILPASCLFNDKLKVTVRDMMKEWDAGTIEIWDRPNGKGKITTVLIFTSGNDKDLKVSTKREFYHDQNGRTYPTMQCSGFVQYETQDGKLVGVGAPLLPIIIDETKGCPYVYK
jgi:hypothetical protein